MAFSGYDEMSKTNRKCIRLKDGVAEQPWNGLVQQAKMYKRDNIAVTQVSSPRKTGGALLGTPPPPPPHHHYKKK